MMCLYENILEHLSYLLTFLSEKHISFVNMVDILISYAFLHK